MIDLVKKIDEENEFNEEEDEPFLYDEDFDEMDQPEERMCHLSKNELDKKKGSCTNQLINASKLV